MTNFFESKFIAQNAFKLSKKKKKTVHFNSMLILLIVSHQVFSCNKTLKMVINYVGTILTLFNHINRLS